MKTFVFEETEVKMTGREAVKSVKLPNGKAREMRLVEITPVADFDWKKWVNPDHLYEVQSTAKPP